MLHYTLKTLSRRRKELIVSVFALTLCVMLVTASVGAAISVKTSISDRADEMYGTFRAVEPTDSPEKAGLGIYGSIISEKSIFSGQLTVGYVTSDLLPVRLISGRLPEKPGEAAVEESLGQALMTGISVGDEAEFTIKTPEGETRTLSLTVVGFTKSTSRLSVNDGKRYLVPSIIVAEGAIDCFPDIYSVTSGESYSSDAMINPRYTDAVIVSVSESTRVLLTVTAILTVMAAAVSAFVFVSVTKPVMNRHFADLRLAGAGGRELAEFTVLRTLVLSLFAAAVGTTAGYGCLAVFTRTVLEHFLDSCTVSFPWVACLLTCIGIFAVITLPGLSAVRKAVSHRPLEAVQAKRRTAAGQSRPISPNGVSYSIFGKWTRETSKKRRAMAPCLTAAMSIACLAVFAGSAFGTTIRDEYRDNFTDDYTVKRFGEGFYSYFRIPEHPYYGLTDDTLSAISAAKEAEYVSYTKTLNAALTAAEKLGLTAFFGDDIKSVYGQDDTEFKKITSRFSLSTDAAYYALTVIECDDRLFSMLEAENGKSYRSQDGDGVVMVCRDMAASPFRAGNRLHIFQALPGSSGAEFGSDCGIFDADVTLTGIAEVPITSYLRGKLGSGFSPTLVVTEGFFSDHGYDKGADSVFIGLTDGRKHEKTDAVLASVMPSLPESTVISKSDNEAEKTALLGAVSYSAAVTAVFLSAVCIAVFASATRADLLAERRTIGVLRSIGLDRGRMLKRHIRYTLGIFGKAAMINFLTLLLLNFLPVRKDIKGYPPVIFISYIVFTAAALAVTLPTVRRLFTERIADMTGGTTAGRGTGI